MLALTFSMQVALPADPQVAQQTSSQPSSPPAAAFPMASHPCWCRQAPPDAQRTTMLGSQPATPSPALSPLMLHGSLPCTTTNSTKQSSTWIDNPPAAAASAFSMRRCCLRRRCSRRSASPFSSAASSPLLRRRVSPRLLQQTGTRSCRGLGILRPPQNCQQACCMCEDRIKGASVPLLRRGTLLSLLQQRVASSHPESGDSSHAPLQVLQSQHVSCSTETRVEAEVGLTDVPPLPPCAVLAATRAPCCVQAKGERASLSQNRGLCVSRMLQQTRSHQGGTRGAVGLGWGCSKGHCDHHKSSAELTWQRRACAARVPCSHPRRLCRCLSALHEHDPSHPCAEPPGQLRRP